MKALKAKTSEAWAYHALKTANLIHDAHLMY